MEAGADLGFLNNRLTVNATWYQKSTTDQILPVSISGTTGFTSAVVNSGDVRNRGFEIAVGLTQRLLAVHHAGAGFLT